jgi:hypothetical protein
MTLAMLLDNSSLVPIPAKRHRKDQFRWCKKPPESPTSNEPLRFAKLNAPSHSFDICAGCNIFQSRVTDVRLEIPPPRRIDGFGATRLVDATSITLAELSEAMQLR